MLRALSRSAFIAAVSFPFESENKANQRSFFTRQKPYLLSASVPRVITAFVIWESTVPMSTAAVKFVYELEGLFWNVLQWCLMCLYKTVQEKKKRPLNADYFNSLTIICYKIQIQSFYYRLYISQTALGCYLQPWCTITHGADSLCISLNITMTEHEHQTQFLPAQHSTFPCLSLVNPNFLSLMQIAQHTVSPPAHLKSWDD